MRNKGYLIIAGSLNFFIALIHISAMLIGPVAYDFLDVPMFAYYAAMGSAMPMFITSMATLLYILFGLYAFLGAGGKIQLPFQEQILKVIGWLFVLRGLFLFWFLYQMMMNLPMASLKEVGFSLFSLMIGYLYLKGGKFSYREAK